MRAETVMLETLMHELRTMGNPVFTDTTVVRYRTDGYCMVMANGSLEGIADEVIEREIAYHWSINRSFEWKLFSNDLPEDMIDHLIAHNFVVGPEEVVCGVDLATFEPNADATIRVEKVTTEEQLIHFRTVAEVVFGRDYSFTTGVLRDCIAEGSEAEVGFVAYDGEVPVSIGRLDSQPGATFGGLYTGGTLSGWRGKGFYRAVVAARASYAWKAGLKYLCVDALPTSLPILQRLGFEALVETWPCDFTVT